MFVNVTFIQILKYTEHLLRTVLQSFPYLNRIHLIGKYVKVRSSEQRFEHLIPI